MLAPADPPLLSVVVTAHDEAPHIAATVKAVLGQQGLPGPLEMVLVDDRSTDGTAEAAEAAGDHRLTVLSARPDPASPLTTRQQALDLGFRAARGRVILTLDADSRVSPGWAAAMARPILEERADAAAGPVGFLPDDHWVARWQTCDAHYYFLVSAMVARLGGAGGVFFGNFAFRRGLYEELGGFAALGFALTEDLAFALATQREGGRVAFLGTGTRVDVAACPDFDALVTRTLRVSKGPPSALATVLTVWPLTLPALFVAALIGGGWALWLAFLIRYGVGVALVRAALGDHPSARVRRFAPFYEPGAFVLAGGVLSRILRRRAGVAWGGKRYGG